MDQVSSLGSDYKNSAEGTQEQTRSQAMALNFSSNLERTTRFPLKSNPLGSGLAA